MEIDLNEIIISGTINNVTDNNKDYIKFGLTTLKYDKRKVYSSLNINRNLYTIYKDFFVKGTKVFIRGYLNGPHIRIDPDGVEVWNGKREESIPPTEEELKEMKELLKEFE